MKFISHFKELDKDSVQSSGGKGASLGEMTRAQIPVPAGFVVLTKAFEHFLHTSNLHSEIDGILHKVDHQVIHTIDQASEQIKGLIFAVPMPSEIEKEILTSFSSLNSPFVAVRSSATAEDSSAAAWAGQLDSFLNTTKKDLLLNG